MKMIREGTNCIKRRSKLLIGFLACSLAFSGSAYVYAKYYSVSAKEGIAIATGVYFTSNYAQETEDGSAGFVENLAVSGYRGGDTSFILEVRNYENNLLFNADNVNIPYTVEMWLEKDPTDGTEYSVSAGKGINETKTVLKGGEDHKVTFDRQSISGGAAKANSYYVNIDAPGDTGHVPIAVYVRIRTVEGALIDRVLTGKLILSSSGGTASYIESQQFVIPKTPADKDDFEKLNTLSAFTYEIQTAGSAMSSEVTEQLKIAWDPTVLTIDLFDEAYRKWQKDTGNNAPLSGDNGWQYIEIDFVPYAAENIVFFRGSEYETKAVSLEGLNSYIKAEKIVKSAG